MAEKKVPTDRSNSSANLHQGQIQNSSLWFSSGITHVNERMLGKKTNHKNPHKNSSHCVCILLTVYSPVDYNYATSN